MSYGAEQHLLEVCIANVSTRRVIECCPPRSREDRFNFMVKEVKFPASGRNTFKHTVRGGQVDVYHCCVVGEHVYICYSTPNAQLRVVYNFLAELEECHRKGRTGVQMLSELLEKWNRPDSDKVNAARVKVDQIKQVMIQNIDKALYRGTALAELDDRTTKLMESSSEFKQAASDLKCKFLKEKWKLIGIIVGVVVVIIIIIVVSVVLTNQDGGGSSSGGDTPSDPSRMLLELLDAQ